MNFEYTGKGKISTSISSFSSSFLDKDVRFSFKYTKTHNKYCLSKSKWLKMDLNWFYNAISHRECFTWKQFLSWKKNWWIDKEKWQSHKELHTSFPQLDNFWHFYIQQCSSWVWRVFWGYKDGIFYILYIDVNGKFHESAHK